MKIAIIFHSPSGTTKQLAQAIAEGAAQPDIEVIQAEIVGADIEDGRFRNTELLQQLTRFDALVFGSPTYMGSVTAQFKAFADATRELWEQQNWAFNTDR
ncbi:flavodoxin family protein [Salinispirillum marinum]|uniref:Flavodoxin family protein n=2 Tax=Saccharospirillaceae TaxID=255527 RepID=A0ABV8BHB7_9GAMM